MQKRVVAGVVVGALFGVAAYQIVAPAWLAGQAERQSPVQDSGPFRALVRQDGGFAEFRDVPALVVDQAAPPDLALLYCFHRTQRLVIGKQRIDRTAADGSVAVLQDQAVTLQGSRDFRLQPVDSAVRNQIGDELQRACREAESPRTRIGWRIDRIAAML